MAANPPPELAALDEAIRLYPDAAINYVLRGEYWLRQRRPDQALPDFQQALRLAAAELAASDWGYREQAVADRAQAGYQQATQLMTVVRAR